MLQNTSYVVINIKSYSKIWLSFRNLRHPSQTNRSKICEIKKIQKKEENQKKSV